MDEEHKAYSRKTLDHHLAGLFAWVVVTVLMGFYAREAPRELTAIYALMVGCYAWCLSRQDRGHTAARIRRLRGEMAEWLKAHAWKACVR